MARKTLLWNSGSSHFCLRTLEILDCTEVAEDELESPCILLLYSLSWEGGG